MQEYSNNTNARCTNLKNDEASVRHGAECCFGLAAAAAAAASRLSSARTAAAGVLARGQGTPSCAPVAATAIPVAVGQLPMRWTDWLALSKRLGARNEIASKQGTTCSLAPPHQPTAAAARRAAGR